MSVKATKEYVGVPRDSVDKFHGKQIVYLNWHQHLLFAAAFMTWVEPELTFGDYIGGPITALIAADPDAAAVEWDKVEWKVRGESFTPDFAKSLADNGIGHKDLITMHTPGLNTLCGGSLPS
ncbi:phenol hydroxylase subunit P4 [Granulicoccus phenolivorans]|uniref:phenol hydroxylase subunit P4 n=1 Tax=Granulicoccus phenolivorans TaxID=266854 RepID=UPI0004125515|nr:phenol hydroxylase subunit P4 [Granulicoccus phenolivorans]